MNNINEEKQNLLESMRKIRYMKFLNKMILLCAFLWGACTDDDFITQGITILEPSVTDVTNCSATVKAKIAYVSSDMHARGICYATVSSPTIRNENITLQGTLAQIEVALNNLLENTTYYVRAFVTMKDGRTIYSQEKSFTTSAISLEEQLASYEPPAYNDDYTSISSWANRSLWNLANVHDPSVVKADDGYYYMYQTDTSYGNVHTAGGHFHCRRSKDLVNWEYMGGVLQYTPSWIKTKLNEFRAGAGLEPIDTPTYGYWAPVVRKVSSGKYRMYYAVTVTDKIDGTDSWGERAFIGLMETSDPAANKWKDKGYVICSSSDKGVDWSRPDNSGWNAYFKWNAIDPSYVITPAGEHWLVYGSWHSGIAAVRLNPETGMVLYDLPLPWGTSEDIAPYGQLVARRDNSRWQGSEAPEVIYRDGYYYMFLAYDAVEVPYNTRVVRSEKITGPYKGIDGIDVSSNNGGAAYPVVTHPYKFANSTGWVGIAHCAIFDDGAGNWFYASQGRLPEGVSGINSSNAVMMGHIRSIRWTEDGWPLVMPERYGAVPQVPVTEEELIGNWEHIPLNYVYGKQQVSVAMTLSAGHKVTAGEWNGQTWSYDADKRVLTVGTVKLYLQREVDWEASPRKATIVFAGYDGKKTHWGKKVS
jgi:Beta-xylosidase